MRERPLWAIATDSLANRLLAVGRALGDVPRATALAGPLAAAIGAPLPAPRYVDVRGRPGTRRASCCLLYRVPGEPLCTSCPRRPPAERRILLEGLCVECVLRGFLADSAHGRKSIESPNSCQR